MSEIEPRTREIVDLYMQEIVLRRKGLSLWGPNLSEWPAWAVDAWTALAEEEQKVIEAHAQRNPHPG